MVDASMGARLSDVYRVPLGWLHRTPRRAGLNDANCHEIYSCSCQQATKITTGDVEIIQLDLISVDLGQR